MRNKLCLIDAHSIIHRCFHANMMNLTAPNGEDTKATFGFVRIVDDFWGQSGFTHCITAFDSNKLKLKKRQLVPDYKDKRSVPDESVIKQLKRCRMLTKMMGIHRVLIEGYEADDIIGSAVTKFASDADITIVTCDKDMMQLLGKGVAIYHPFERRHLKTADVVKKWGVRPEKVLEVMTLCGDPTDNVKGIPGVGAITAAKLILEHGTAEAAQKAWDSAPNKIKLALKTADLKTNRFLMSLLPDAPLRKLKAYKAPATLKSTEVRQALAELGFHSLLKTR